MNKEIKPSSVQPVDSQLPEQNTSPEERNHDRLQEGHPDTANNNQSHHWRYLRLLAYVLFFTFAMTTDAVGVIIPVLISEFDISLTGASAFHYTTMAAIALSGALLGFLPDKIGHQNALLLGLALYGLSCMLFMFANAYSAFLVLLFIGGLAIGVFKTSALAMIGDITQNDAQHTKTMNVLEGFFAVGAVAGPFLATRLIEGNLDWQYLYLIASILCFALFIFSLKVKFPVLRSERDSQVGLRNTMKMFYDPYALFFGSAIAAYVVIEVAIYVWMPTLLADYTGSYTTLATYALTIFFILRALGRFLGVWLLSLFSWTSMLVFLALMIFLCYLGSYIGGIGAAVFLLPLSGLFMSMVYPTLNSKGISCFPKIFHGSIAGLLLFFTAIAAVVGPIIMGVIGDMNNGDLKYGFAFATAVSCSLFILMVFNHIYKPAEKRLKSQL